MGVGGDKSIGMQRETHLAGGYRNRAAELTAVPVHRRKARLCLIEGVTGLILNYLASCIALGSDSRSLIGGGGSRRGPH